MTNEELEIRFPLGESWENIDEYWAGIPPSEIAIFTRAGTLYQAAQDLKRCGTWVCIYTLIAEWESAKDAS